MRTKILNLFLGIIALCAFEAQAQGLLEIKGTILNAKGNPIPFAEITALHAGNKSLSSGDGTFTILAGVYDTLSISCVGYEKQLERVLGRTKFDIVMGESNTILSEVTITSMISKNGNFVFDPTQLEVIRDQLLIKTRYRVPENRFHKASRLVIHPYLVNYTKNQRTEFTPIVFDGVHYDILTKRGNICGDTIEKKYYSQFAKVVKDLKSEKMFSYVDSCKIEGVNDRYATEVYIKISTFCEDEYLDTMVIAQGIVYPMRFFDFSATSYDLDNSYAPKQQMINFNLKGEMNLWFRPNNAQIFEQDGNNGAELNKFRKILGAIDADTTKALTSFNIVGFTSPEGTYELNSKLSRKRVKAAMEKITQNISKETLQKARLQYDAVVTPWDSVYSALVKDSMMVAANELSNLMRRARGRHDEISWGVRKLKSYGLIRDKYLPRFRKVEYNYEYSEMRTLNVEEIRKLYDDNPANLTASEFWRLIVSDTTICLEDKEKLMREALHYYPDLMIAANNLAALLNRDRRADTTLLVPFLKKEEIPMEVKINQVVACLQTRDFVQANGLCKQLPYNEKTAMVKAMEHAMNGRYGEAYDYFKNYNCLNRVILLLCMHRDQEALACIRHLDDPSAEAAYVKAIVYNRVDDVMNAVTQLKKALELKPELKEIIKIDGDVLDLIDLL